MNDSSLCFVFHQNKILLNLANESFIPCYKELNAFNLSQLPTHEIGQFHDTPCLAIEVAEPILLAPNYEFQPLRQAALNLLSPLMFHFAGKAMQILEWDRTHQFCSHCGLMIVQSTKERAKACPGCQHVFYPRISPTIIVAVKRDDKLLLARSPHFNDKMYSILAGFIEPGESAEEAVHREVKEEVGIEITNVRYLYSQSWPFSSALMLGFAAEHAKGEIHIDQIEISDAAWYSVDNLPQLPSPISISRKLIDLFIQGKL